MQVTFLGTGTSHGVPCINCKCKVCTDAKTKSKNYRTRSSIILHYKNKNILIDTSMDFRLQMIENNIKTIDCVLFTHEHADHIFGLPDIRSYTIQNHIPCYSHPRTAKYLKRTFDYIFHPVQIGGGIPDITINEAEKPFTFKDIHIIPIPVMHGILPVYGYRIGELAYIPDVSEIPQTSMKLLQNLKILILDALRVEKHETHLSLKESLELADKINPDMCYFTHISHHLNHNRTLPKNRKFAFDSLSISL